MYNCCCYHHHGCSLLQCVLLAVDYSSVYFWLFSVRLASAWLEFLSRLLISYFHYYWNKLPFRSVTDVTSHYSSPSPETVFFSACCVETQSLVCTLCIKVGNRRQCFLYAFICCVLQICFLFFTKYRAFLVGLCWYNLLGPACLRWQCVCWSRLRLGNIVSSAGCRLDREGTVGPAV